MSKDFDAVREQDYQRAWVLQILAKQQKDEFFGTISIKMEKGIVRRIVKEENIIPPPSPPR